ncbi:hypothetical protein D6833_12215, partial [Candidatus Parcubacteria bacterium]
MVGSTSRKRLLVLASHPVPYWVPLYRRLSEESWLELLVAYGDVSNVLGRLERWGQKNFRWSGNLLDGYPFIALRNVAPRPDPTTPVGKINPGLPRLLSAWRPDAVLVSGYSHLFHVLAFLASWRYGVPVLYVGDSNSLMDSRRGWRRVVRRPLLRSLYARLDLCLFVGRRNREHYERHGVPPERLVRFALAV